LGKIVDGKVAVVTGAGRGIGRGHALALAEQGAKVIVNDVGLAADGSGASKEPADNVVQEIKQLGGSAVANYDSVATPEGGQGIINTAIDKFGRLDILVNNAGLMRDKMIFNMTDEEWDMCIKVNMYGVFYCTRAACKVMREQKYGRIITTSSISGLGAIGQSNYAAAKEGIVGFSRTVAKDMLKYGVTCNVIRPRAGTRMTITDELYQARRKAYGDDEALKWKHTVENNMPEDVAPFVVYLASEQAGNISACVFDVFHNYIGLYDDPPGVKKSLMKEEGRWLPEELIELMPKTLAAGLEAPPNWAPKKVTTDAQGWEWASGKLKEVPAVFM
jgi:3-oxoacyl-[acyl-carrier protein] reductase